MIIGIPDPNTIWGVDEYYNCLKELKTLKTINYYGMPQKGSKKSGILFDRIVSKDNVLQLGNSEKDKYIYENLLAIYSDYDYYRRPSYYHVEQAEIIVCLLQLLDKSFNGVRRAYKERYLNLPIRQDFNRVFIA